MEDAVPLKSRRLSIRPRVRYLLLTAIVLLAAAGLGTGLYFWLSGDGGGESVRVVTAVQIPNPDGWSEQTLTEADRNAGLLLSLERDRPQASFLARTVVARLTPDFDINQLADDTEAALSTEIENFDLLSKSVTPIGPFDAVRISYRQTGESGLTDRQVLDRQVLMTIVPTANQTFYLTFQAEQESFLAIEDEGSEITTTFVAYVAEALR